MESVRGGGMLMSDMPQQRTQVQRLLQRLLEANGGEVSVTEIISIAGQYGPRMWELRKQGFRVTNRPGFYKLELRSDDDRLRALEFIQAAHTKRPPVAKSKTASRNITHPPKNKIFVPQIKTPIVIGAEELARVQFQIEKINSFLNALRADIYRARKENSEKERGKWNPDPISKMRQKELLDWIEQQLEDNVPKP